MSASPNLKLPYIDANQNQKSVTHNEALRILDALVNLHVASNALAAPPLSPTDGQCWIVASGASGAWLGKDLNVAAWQDGAWIFYAPNPGFVAYVDTIGGALMWTGAAWVSLLGAVAQLSLTALGIGTAADSHNPLSAKLNAALFAAVPTTASPAGTGDVRLALSKQGAGNTASVLFQDNYSGRAEFGLTGDDNFHMKVSPDGATFYNALTIVAAGGGIALLTAPTHPSPAAGDTSTASATTAWVAAKAYATLASPALTGTPSAPTQATGDNSARLATTAYADRGSAANFTRTQVNDAAYAVSAGDRTVAVIALTAARVLTLPAASAFPLGATLTVIDESGACSATTTITLARAGADTISGAASAVLSSPYAYLALESNGSNKWTVIDQPSGVVASLNGGPLAGHRNRLVNGNFAVNQRAYASNTALLAAAYGHDRWKAGGSGCTYTFAAGTPDTAIAITAGTLLQIVEASNVEGGVYVLSWTGTATARIYQGTPSGSYGASPLVVTGLAGGANTTIEFAPGTLGKAQVEPGSIATPFERRPAGLELSSCQRYYQRYTSATASFFNFSGYAPSGNYIQFYLSSKTTMRTTPAFALIGTWTTSNVGSSGQNVSPDIINFYFSVSSTGMAYYDNPANGGFELNAEL